MEQKKRLTVLNVAVAHLTSALMLPIIWILIGSIIQWILGETKTLSNHISSPLYYLVLIASYYGGLKYSFWYVSKNIIVTQPKKSSKLSSFLFYLGLLLIYYAFYTYLDEHNYLRLGTFFVLAYMYTTLTSKYFSSLEPDNELNEYRFMQQIGFTVVNISLVIMLAILTIWLIKEYPRAYGFYIIILVFWMGDYGSKINNFLFVPYFYKDGETVPYKKVFVSLCISIPANIFLACTINQDSLS